MIYMGVGSRSAPIEVQTDLAGIASFLARGGNVLRSGGADGSDQAFEMGCDVNDGPKEIYLPWKGFNRNQSPLFNVTREARLLSKLYHPKWEVMGNVARDLMGRNAYQALGLDLKTPADFMVCWTPGGEEVGGTGQAIRLANHYRIPIFNLGAFTKEEVYDMIMDMLL